MTFCPTKEQITKSFCALFPRGRAWESVDAPGTYLNQLVSGISGGVQQVEQRACDMIEEMFCSTATETLDLWKEDYSAGWDCDPFANDVCAKVATAGGTDFTYYEEMALRLEWVIRCYEIDPVDVCGDNTGFAQLGPQPIANIPGSNLGLAPVGECAEGGEVLGYATGECCEYVRYHELVPETYETPVTVCGIGQVDYLHVAANTPTRLPNKLLQDCLASVDGFQVYNGHAHHFVIEVDVPASLLLQQANGAVFESLGFDSDLGCGVDTGICIPDWSAIKCLIDKIKHAHTVASYQYKLN